MKSAHHKVGRKAHGASPLQWSSRQLDQMRGNIALAVGAAVLTFLAAYIYAHMYLFVAIAAGIGAGAVFYTFASMSQRHKL